MSSRAKILASVLLVAGVVAITKLAHAECDPDAPSAIAPIAVAATAGGDTHVHATIAHFNFENFYDEYDSPESGCDAPGDRGCPGVQEPFNYLPKQPGDYQKKVEKLALAVIDTLHTPDILQGVEVEAQDDCVGGGSLSGECGPGKHDGKPDALQDLANEIFRRSGVRYEVAGDVDHGHDSRGIMPAYLFRADRVTLAPVDATDPVLGARPGDPDRRAFPMNGEVENPKALNTGASAAAQADGAGRDLFERAAQVVKLRVWKEHPGAGAYKDLYMISGHFKSRPDQFVQRREEQAAYTAGLAKQLLAANPHADVLVLGDLNTPDESQLASLTGSLAELNHRMDPAGGAYTYNYKGKLQTLDYMFASPDLAAGLGKIASPHIDSAAQPDERWNADTPHGVSDHDPIEADFQL